MTSQPVHRAEALPRRVRGLRNGRAVIDSDRVELWFTPDSTPFYAIPLDDIDRAAVPDQDCTVLPDGTAPPLRAAVRWDAVDAWFEEDEQVFHHPRDPYRRVDVFASGRLVHWEAGGVVLAESRRAVLLCETGMPGRWYLPALDVESELLRPSDKVTGCPYKGEASHWSVAAGGAMYPDAIWCYRRPLPEAARIAGLLSAEPDQISVSVDGRTLPPEPYSPRWLNPSLWL